MKISDIYWHDSQIEKISIEFDKAELLVESDSKFYLITCTGLIGLTNLCFWDDTILWDMWVENADTSSDVFLKDVFANYDKDYDYYFGGGRILGDDILVLVAHIINNIPAKIYCKKIDVSLLSASE